MLQYTKWNALGDSESASAMADSVLIFLVVVCGFAFVRETARRGWIIFTGGANAETPKALSDVLWVH